jgi:shikimate kinase
MELIMKNVILCGFMGCGKSTVGRALAPLLGMKFVDMDKYIETEAGLSVSSIFKDHGEAYFRVLEAQATKSLSLKGGFVMATGGGAVLSRENVEVFKSCGIIVLIDVPLEIITARLEGDIARPLLSGPSKTDEIRSLYIKRMPIYSSAADFIVSNSDNRSELLIAQEIAKKTIEIL